MAKLLESYPIIIPEAIDLMNVDTNFKLSYIKKDSMINLDYQKISPDLDEYYVDDSSDWNPVTYNLKCEGVISISNTAILYDNYKVANPGTILGVCMTFVSKNTNLTFTQEIGNITVDNNSYSFPFSFNIEKNRLSQKIEIIFSIFVKEAIGDGPFAKIQGSDLGIVHGFVLNIEGSGSIFPIKLIDDASKPLWTMNINYDDLSDDFSIQNICIKINRHHNDYKYLGSEDIDINNYYLWKEILANFFVTLLENSKDEFDLITSNQYEDGTIGCFLNYIVESFGIDKVTIENPIILSENIRKRLDLIIK